MRNIHISILVILFSIISVGTVVACSIPNVTETPALSPIPSIDVITPTEVTPSVEVTTEPTVAPTAGESASVNTPTSDGRSDGLSSCPDCTKAPVLPVKPPATGRN